jgi:hypothetical protein
MRVGYNPWILGWLGAIAAKRGDRVEAQRILALVKSSTPEADPYGYAPLSEALIHERLGDHEQAVAAFLRQWKDGVLLPPHTPPWFEIHAEPDFVAIRDDPRIRLLRLRN